MSYIRRTASSIQSLQMLWMILTERKQKKHVGHVMKGKDRTGEYVWCVQGHNITANNHLHSC